MRRGLLVLGAYSPPRNGAPSDLRTRLFTIAQLDLDWSVCAFGAQEQACLIEAMRLGGDVRVGFENNLHRPDGALAETNAEQVAALAALRTEMKDAA